MPALQRCLSLASRGMADCKKTEDTLEHWSVVQLALLKFYFNIFILQCIEF